MNPKSTPLVTAVIPVYNHEKYVVESIRSILNQSYENIELIVLNDGSKDRSHEVVLPLVEECRKRFVRFEYINRENIGLSGTLNQALAWARGDYFSALASDDVALPKKIEVLVSALEAKGPSYAAAFGNAWFIDDAGHRICLNKTGSVAADGDGTAYDNFLDFYTQGRELNYRGEEFGTYATLISGNYLPAMSNVLKTTAVRDTGGWTPGNAIEDWEMWLKLSKKHGFTYVNEPVALYRWHEMNTAKTSTGGLLHPSMLVVANEKDYCESNNLKANWLETYGSIAYSLLTDRNIPLKRRLSVLSHSHKTSVLSFIAKRLASRF